MQSGWCKNKMTLFENLVKLLSEYRMETPFLKEADIEFDLAKMLRANHIHIELQHPVKTKRYDIICYDDVKNTRVCIELKTKCSTSDARQFDRYLPDFPAGFIIVCWSATQPMREIFEDVERQSNTPVCLVELGKGASIA